MNQRRCCIVLMIAFIFLITVLFYSLDKHQSLQLKSLFQNWTSMKKESNVSELIHKAFQDHQVLKDLQKLQRESSEISEKLEKLNDQDISKIVKGIISKLHFDKSISNLTHLQHELKKQLDDMRNKNDRSTTHSSTTIPFTSSMTTKFVYTLDSFHEPSRKLSLNFEERMKQVKAFEVQITLEERSIMYDLLRNFHKTCQDNGIPYMMYGGTLLGSYRHHDLVPWDDDLDVWMPESNRTFLREIYKKLQPRYILKPAGGHDKIYRDDAFKASAFSWKWPYVDVSFYRENATHIWDITNPYGQTISFPKSITFPFHLRPLYNFSMFAPKDSFAALVWTIGKGDQCKSYGYSHIVEGGGPVGRTTCSNLGKNFPFVQHLPHSKGIREILSWKNQTLTDIVVDEPLYAVSEQYSLMMKEGSTVPPEVEMPKNT